MKFLETLLVKLVNRKGQLLLMDKKVREITFGYVLSWLFGTVALLTGIISLFTQLSIGILFLAIATVLLPPLNKITEKFLKFRISGGLKFILTIILLGVIGAIAKPKAIKNETLIAESQNIKNEIKSIEPGKTYHEVFMFKGNGAKKSEPFTIESNKFKISYDCKGEICSAYLYKVDSNIFTDLIMNAAGPIKDDTIVYGQGTYYIESNSMGKYSIVVYEYK